ncbi:sporulation protein YunB [Sporosarcina highlanderae]|uniref:Sporulation protein YunB n=1 Tax=Sporosarcina highlanderae TaxID=3035916 RepID=A0ABT8JV50_9BACL|nr:sporulation protein YunB [Sporosarcina highlanderae]MDN4609055.1 sporulation protein YunB [Sporosarcina highlanderae]
MRFYGQAPHKYYRKNRHRTPQHRGGPRRKHRWFPIIFPAILLTIVLFVYYVNSKLTPIYTLYAETQTERIAAHVITQAIKSRSTVIYDTNEIIQNVPTESSGMVTNTLNTEIIRRTMAEIQGLIESHLEMAENGNLEMLPLSEDIEYDPDKMEKDGGVVFFVPLGQALDMPMLGNFGPKIPIKFHVIGEVQTDVETLVTEFGINNAIVEVNVLVTVNVQIIVPLATQRTVVQQRIPVAIGLLQSPIPQIYNGGSGNAPQIEIPYPVKGAGK